MQFCLKENIRMMMKKRKTRLYVFSSIFRLQASVPYIIGMQSNCALQMKHADHF